MKVVTANPCDAIERRRLPESSLRGLSEDRIQRLRDRAIILTLTSTRRRRAEVLSMTASSISVEGAAVFYSYRGKAARPVSANCRSLASLRSRLGWNAHAGTWKRCERTNRCGRTHATAAASLAGPSTLTCGATWERLACLSEESTSSGIRQQSSDETLGRPLRKFRGSGPQQPGGDNDIPAAAGGADRRDLGAGGGGDWRLIAYTSWRTSSERPKV